jgi:uncharacterized membrane protein (DUF4010 family)
MARADLGLDVAAKALVLCAVVNTILKGGIVAILGGKQMSWFVNVIFILIALFGIGWLIAA